MQTGRIKHWNALRAFGFIVPDDGGPDVFIHISGLVDGLDALPVGARVTFNTRIGRKHGREEAYDVQITAANATRVFGPR
jgi:CspA family cold shock protein